MLVGALAVCLFVRPSQSGFAAEPSPSRENVGNLRAQEIAQRSAMVQSAFRFLRKTAQKISDPALRRKVFDLLDNPAPTFYLASPTPAEKQKVVQALLARGFVKARDDRFSESGVIAGVFPPVADARQSPQPFWAAPGSSYDSHHSYPGGLVLHEAFNLRSALSLAANYRAQYPGIPMDEDFVIAAPLWHDAMKTTVFQWKDDESEWPELAIASTGAHHILGIAEALYRKLPPKLVVTIAAAHGAPGFEPFGKIVDWLEAAAILAHVDPVQYGVLKRTSAGSTPFELPWPSFPEVTISHLSDGDFVFSVPAAHKAIAVLGDVARSHLMMDDENLHGPAFHHFRNSVFAQLPPEQLYSLWLEGSTEAVLKEIRRLGLLPNGEKNK